MKIKQKQIIILFLLLLSLSSCSTNVYSPWIENKTVEIKDNISIKNEIKQAIKTTKKDPVIQIDKIDKLDTKQVKQTIKEDTITQIDKLKIKQKITHIKTPEKVKAIYYTSYSAWLEYKINSLIKLVKNTEINSVIIDIKTVSWYVSFKMNNDNFKKIKPISNNKNQDIEKIIKKLHDNNVYVIARISTFKDKLLSSNRPDLATKRKDNSKVWTDFKWQKYLDPYSKEVWDYNANIASEAYKIGFDEINFDYVRFPTDWYISNIYYPLSGKIIKNNPKYWHIIVIDEFSNYITTKLKEKHPKIVLSADVFWLVTKYDMLSIWQSLESFVLNFDYIWPMVYPSHYWKWYLWFKNPDNNPYEIIKDAIKTSNKKIDELNKNIIKSNASWSILKINKYFTPKINIKNIWEIPKTKIRPWLQWFSCTRCKNYIPYGRNKFRQQIKAIEDSKLNSWSVWNSASNYYTDWYNKN